jgi:hypothetical protein
MTPRLRKGLLRTWVLLTVVWLLVWGGIAYSDNGIPSINHDCTELLEFTLDSNGQKLGMDDVRQCEGHWRKQREWLGFMAVAPPIGLLALGVMIAWVVAGFRSDIPTST